MLPDEARAHTVSTSASLVLDLALPRRGPAVALLAATSIFHSWLPGIAPAQTVPFAVCTSDTTAIAPGNDTSFLAPASVAR